MTGKIREDSPFRKLVTGLLFLDFKQTADEPEYEAIGRITRKHAVFQRRYQYAQDLERALTEAKLTSKFLSLVENGVATDERSFEPEELITYYDGIFLDHIHQIKDKVFRLIWWLLQDENTKNKVNEPDSIKLKSFLSYQDKLNKVGIAELLQEWNQATNSGVAVALRKRTQHHHFVSNLQLNSDFQKIKMSKNMLSLGSVSMLSDYGKRRMDEIGQESYEKWRTEITNKHSATLELVEKNISDISLKLINYYKIPTEPKKLAKIVNRYLEVQKRFDIENKAAIPKIPSDLKDIINAFVEFNKQFFGQFFVSLYLVGSVSRGEFIPGSSDINIIVITNLDKHKDLPKHEDPLLNIKFFTEAEFQAEEAKKYRFICWSDGVLLAGKEIKFDEREFPKPGTFLALLLNKGFIEELKAIKEKVKRLKNPNSKTLRRYTLKVVKIIMDFGFGVAMSNKPFYTVSRQEKILYIKEMFPSDQRRTLTIERVYKDGLIAHKDFPIIIDNFIANETKNYQKMLSIEKEAKGR